MSSNSKKNNEHFSCPRYHTMLLSAQGSNNEFNAYVARKHLIGTRNNIIICHYKGLHLWSSNIYCLLFYHWKPKYSTNNYQQRIVINILFMNMNKSTKSSILHKYSHFTQPCEGCLFAVVQCIGLFMQHRFELFIDLRWQLK